MAAALRGRASVASPLRRAWRWHVAPPRAAPRLVDRGASSRRRRSSASDAPSSTRPLRLHPPPSPPLLPRVEHVILPSDARAAGPACEVLARLVPGSPRVDETTIRELVALGAVWHAPRPPPPRPLKGLPGALRPRRVRDPDLHLAPGAYCRVHVHPKRFPAAFATAWRSSVLAHGEAFVVVDKPAGVNCGATVDNAAECVAHCVASALANPSAAGPLGTPRSWSEVDPLLVTHRLDAATAGVLVLAKTSAFARWFNEQLKARNVRKLYRCATRTPVPLGVMEHWTDAGASEDSSPPGTPRRHLARALAATDEPWRPEDGLPTSLGAPARDGSFSTPDAFTHPDGRKRLVLRVLRCERLGGGGAAGGLGEGGGSSSALDAILAGGAAFESEVELVTGRTHQIRAQFAAVGAPLLGDALYGGEDLSLSVGDVARTSPRVLDENDRLCLQAARVTMGVEGPTGPAGATFEAGTPWWRKRDEAVGEDVVGEGVG